VSLLNKQRRLRIERQKKRKREGYLCMIIYTIISISIIVYLGWNLNIFYKILLSILSISLWIVIYYLIYNFLIKNKKAKISFDKRY